MNFESNKEFSVKLDNEDPLKKFRSEFNFPESEGENSVLYFAGHSLGLMPKRSKEYINEELDAWAKYGVEGHFNGKHPWLPYHEFLNENMANVVGGKPNEVVVMNSLTVNLHLMMVSFYRPTKERNKILIENNTFPSDRYAALSQVRTHGFDPETSVIEFSASQNDLAVSNENILQTIEDHKEDLSLILLGNCNYLSGQAFPIEKIVKLAHEYGIKVGLNLAHGAGNLMPDLHNSGVDFAVWCSYKYLNSGPGGIAGAFVHERHLQDKTIPRFEGWWGQNKETRFEMGPNFDPIQTVEAWQLSNPPIFQLASLRASLEIFAEAGMKNLRSKGDHLTGYLEYLLNEKCRSHLEVMTPEVGHRGSMLSIRMKKNAKKLVDVFKERGVICDFRYPDILRITPIPLYNNYSDVYSLVDIIDEVASE